MAGSISTGSRSICGPRSTKIIIRTRSARHRRPRSWRMNSARRKSLASTACVVTSRYPTRATMMFEVADRLGLLVWTELPNLGLLTERSGERKLATLKGIVDRDGNHPSIVCWTIINENWGVDLVHDPDHRAWLQQAFRWLKSYDPGRLVVDNSPLAPSFHVQTDIADYHFYAAFPDNRRGWDQFVNKLAA